MYDASLDQFEKHEWTEPDIWNITYAENQFISNAGFGITGSDGNFKNERNIEIVNIIYDQLLKPSLLGNLTTLNQSLKGRKSGVSIETKNL